MRPAQRRTATAVAVVAWAGYVALSLAMLVSEAAAGRATVVDAATTLAFLMFASVGALLVARQPRNAVGWTLLLVALFAIGQRTASGLVEAAEASPGVSWRPLIAWVDSWMWGVSVATAMLVLPAVFPDGRLPGGRLGLVAALMFGVFALAPIFFAIAPGPFVGVPDVVNPFGLAVLGPVVGIGRDLLPAVGVVPIVVCAAIPLVRFRRATPDQRAQIKWFAFSAVLLATTLIANSLTDGALEIPLAVAIGLVPAAIGVAILRYRLYDIDLIINRTLVWVPLTALLGGGYAALVALLQRIFVNVTGDRSDAAIIISTLMLAALFTPIRRVLDSIVDARFRVSGSHRAGSGQSVPVRADATDSALDRRIETIAARVAREVLAEERSSP